MENKQGPKKKKVGESKIKKDGASKVSVNNSETTSDDDNEVMTQGNDHGNLNNIVYVLVYRIMSVKYITDLCIEINIT